MDRIKDDDTLIVETLAGDESAFAELVRRHQRQVYRVAWAIVKDDTDADLVTQDTFIQAFTHLAKFERRSQLETWLTRIAINRARDVLRQKKSVRLFAVDAADGDDVTLRVADDRPDPERQYLSSELGEAIERAERSLSAKQKAIFRLRHHAELPLDEIAKQLGLRAATVRVHLFRAVRKIRKELCCWRRQPVTETIDVRAFE